MRFLKRLAIKLRWPAAIVAGLLVAVAGWSCLYCQSVVMRTSSRTLSIQYERLRCGVVLMESGVDWGNEWDLRFNSRDANWQTVARAPWDSLWRTIWTAPRRSGLANTVSGVSFPIWYLVLPAAVLAVVGFRLKRREPTPGSCVHCGYPPAAAAVCPECGATLPGASNTSPPPSAP